MYLKKEKSRSQSSRFQTINQNNSYWRDFSIIIREKVLLNNIKWKVILTWGNWGVVKVNREKLKLSLI